MIVLGINDGHQSGACLLKDGELVVCILEERRRNVKNFAGVPTESINWVFQRTGIAPSDIALVSLSSRIRTTVPTPEPKLIYSFLRGIYWMGQTDVGTAIGQRILSRVRKRRQLMDCLAQHGLSRKPIVAYDHHLTHAACAFFHRPWEGDATVLTLDGAGDGVCATVSVGSGTALRLVSRTPKFHSPAAWMYSALTAHLGLRPYEHEYKVMGMAPYGQPDICAPFLREAFRVCGLTFRNQTGRVGQGLQKTYARRLYGQRFDNIAAACQLVFEEMMLKWVKNAVRRTGISRVACAGGAFLNVKANKLIREMTDVESFYAYPASDDGGTPVGAAILGYVDLCKQNGVSPKLNLPPHMYLGIEYSDEELRKAAIMSGLKWKPMKSEPKELAAMLAKGLIVGRFSGREELGPRALGNRSILADPRDLKMVRRLNFAIKQRDFWMPFAPSILEEDARKYIRNLSGWPYYMIEAFDTTPLASDAIIAALHPHDLTVRPQVVNGLNAEYREIIREFKVLTGTGAVLNTSFNLHGYPIVGAPGAALETLKKSDLDAVALGPLLVRKTG